MAAYFEFDQPRHPEEMDYLIDVVRRVVRNQNDVHDLTSPVRLAPGDAAYLIGGKKDLLNYFRLFWTDGQFETTDQQNLGFMTILKQHHLWSGLRNVSAGAVKVVGSSRKLLPGQHEEKASLKKRAKRQLHRGLNDLLGNEPMIMQVFHTAGYHFGLHDDGTNGIRICGHTLTFGALATLCTIWTSRQALPATIQPVLPMMPLTWPSAVHYP
jgi:hypothetical protein